VVRSEEEWDGRMERRDLGIYIMEDDNNSNANTNTTTSTTRATPLQLKLAVLMIADPSWIRRMIGVQEIPEEWHPMEDGIQTVLSAEAACRGNLAAALMHPTAQTAGIGGIHWRNGDQNSITLLLAQSSRVPSHGCQQWLLGLRKDW
jgi:hypothetical protein